MVLLTEFINVYIQYGRELWLILAVGFFLSGVFYQFVPTKMVEKHLGKGGLKPIFLSSIVGVILPVCCLGSLPIALTLRKKGAQLGAVLAFLVATPATSISALFVCWKLMGLAFTTYIFFAVIIMAVILGILVNWVKIKDKNMQETKDCCHDEKENQSADLSFAQKVKNVFTYAFITLPKEIGFEILIGIGIASFISVFAPIQHFIQQYLSGMFGYVFIIIMGLITYVCSTASVPLADALLNSGMSYGQAMCYLLVGPITSYGTILVIRKDFGIKILTLYLGVISIFSLLYGIIYDMLY